MPDNVIIYHIKIQKVSYAVNVLNYVDTLYWYIYCQLGEPKTICRYAKEGHRT